MQDLVGDIAEVMELVEGAFSGVLERYPDMEMTFLRLQYYNMPNMASILSPNHSQKWPIACPDIRQDLDFAACQ